VIWIKARSMKAVSKGGCQFHIRISGVPNDRIAVRLRRDHAKFPKANLTLLAEQTRTAMMPTDLSKGRRAGEAPR
jgi:hypothetical protein